MFTNVSVSVSDIWWIGSIVAYYQVSLTHDGSVSDYVSPSSPNKAASRINPCRCHAHAAPLPSCHDCSILHWQVQEYTEGSDEHPRPSVRMAPRLNFLFVPSHSQTIRDHRTSRKASKRDESIPWSTDANATQMLASPASLKGDNSAGKTSSTMFDIQTSNIFKQ